jgi:hypothetical protein
MAINKALNIGVKKAYKQGDWLGFTAVEVIPKTLKDRVNNTDWGKIHQAKIDKINDLLKTEGYKINENIDYAKLSEQIKFIINYRDSERKKYATTYNLNPSAVDWTKSLDFDKFITNVGNNQKQLAHEQLIQAEALNYVLQAMLKEQTLRDEVNSKIEVATREDTLEAWNKIKDAWRSIEQKTTIQDNIKRVEKVIKASEEAAKSEAEKQAKIDKLNQQMANTTNVSEKKALAAQISELMGTVSTQTGMPKGALYIGIGVAVVVGIWITIRAIRK